MSVHTVSETNFGTSANTAPADKSLGELFGDLTRESSQLVREEINLAKVEITQKAVRASKDVGMIVGGVIVASTGLLVLTAFFVLCLIAAHLAPWIAALIVAVVYLVGGGLVAWQGVSALKHVDPIPHATVDTLKEDAQWLKNRH